MNEAIKLAIEKGGYNPGKLVGDGDTIEIWLKLDADDDENDVALDPLFWQALGKVLGWKDFAGRGEGEYPIWKWQAHRYFDLILTSSDTEKFWKELIAQ